MLPDKTDSLSAARSDAAADYGALAARVRAGQASTGHVPVLLEEVLTHLVPRTGGIYVDATFGTGGYSRAILEAADCILYAIDRDPAAIARAQALSAEYQGRLHALEGCFGDIKDLLAAQDIAQIDGLVLDLGVSSPQLDQAARGFSFREDGPLDMRMSAHGRTAADLVNTASEEDLADIIFAYGDERASRRIARRIVAARTLAPITTTRALAAVVHEVLPMHGGMKSDTATRTFQALRIAVNDELGELERVLDSSLGLLAPGGRLVVVSFHSLEDGYVKRFFKKHSGDIAAPSRHLPQAAPRTAPLPPLQLPVNKPISASTQEIAENPRARSARLRVAMRRPASPQQEGADA